MSTSRIIFFSLLLTLFYSKLPLANLLSYQSEYEITLANSEKIRLPGKTYVNDASGQLFNRRLVPTVTRFSAELDGFAAQQHRVIRFRYQCENADPHEHGPDDEHVK